MPVVDSARGIEELVRDVLGQGGPGRSARDLTHTYYQYPAMMHPALQRSLLRALLARSPSIQRIADPFLGSGTMLVEAMLSGRDFLGADVNPLAILLAKTKSGPHRSAEVDRSFRRVVKRAERDLSDEIYPAVPKFSYWFEEPVGVRLTRLRNAIRKEPRIWIRRFHWTVMAETIRLCSNDRTSTFKLHKRIASELGSNRPEPLEVFSRIGRRNLSAYADQQRLLARDGLLDTTGRYVGMTQIDLSDAREWKPTDKADIAITSPPYGDNRSTVPYGQASYLQLSWLDMEDIDRAAGTEYLRTASEIDRRSLGGEGRMADADLIRLRRRSPTLASTLDGLADLPPDRSRRVASFVRDLDHSLNTLCSIVQRGGTIMMVVGNRSVGGRPVPTDRILNDLMKVRGHPILASVPRRIPPNRKRMALRNERGETMSSERILAWSISS